MDWILYGVFVLVAALVGGLVGYKIRSVQLNREIRRLVKKHFKHDI